MDIGFDAEVGEFREGAGDVFGDLREAGVGEGGVFEPEVAVGELVGGSNIEFVFPEHSVLLGALLLGAAAVLAVLAIEDVRTAVQLLV